MPDNKLNLKHSTSISFVSLVSKYASLQSAVVSFIQNLASSLSSANPGKFLLAQFYMSQVTQIGESISNLIAQVTAIIRQAISNQKTQ